MDQNLILTQLQTFFPLIKYTSENIHQYVESDELDISEKSLANTLKGALLNESIVEVKLPDFEQVFFCRILDNPFPDAGPESMGDQDLNETNHETGSYLDNHNSLIITPLEPSMGNFLISAHPNREVPVLLRIISSGEAVEIGCFFEQRTSLGDMPVLKLSFPLVARKTSSAREFRVKVPKGMNFKVTVERPKKKTITTTPLNISINGMSLIDPMGRQTDFQTGQKILCDLQIPSEEPVLVEASIIHVTNLRNSTGIQHCFGLKFNFRVPAVKSSIEKIVALVQRKHLRELSDIEEQFGVYYDK
ncbi:PilZ domain-containing protein [Desulforhopalus sp. 52FAK]